MGVPVLRFDLFGAGDSGGEDQDGELEGWRQDVLDAHAELMRLSGVNRAIWLGSRLGAALALLSAASADERLNGVLLWDPVVNGAAYVDEIRRKHLEALDTSYGVIGYDWRGQMTLSADNISPLEAIGFAVSKRLQEQMTRFVADLSAVPERIDVRVVGKPTDRVLAAWMDQQGRSGRSVQFQAMTHDFEWTTEEALNRALVPMDVLQRLVDLLSAGG